MTDAGRDEYLFEPPQREDRQALPVVEGGVGEWLHDRLIPEEYQDKPLNNWSYDWCAYRRDQRCYYPRTLDERASEEAGYPVWIPEDRGFCPRHKWEEQKACPISLPGPDSGELEQYPDQTRTWDEGGQRYSALQQEALRLASEYEQRTAAMDNDRWTKLEQGSYLSPDNKFEAVDYGGYWALMHYPPRGGDSLTDGPTLSSVKEWWAKQHGREASQRREAYADIAYDIFDEGYETVSEWVWEHEGGSLCHDVAEAVEQQFGYEQVFGVFIKDDGTVEAHSWNVTERGNIIDLTYHQFLSHGTEADAFEWRKGEPEHGKYRQLTNEPGEWMSALDEFYVQHYATIDPPPGRTAAEGDVWIDCPRCDGKGRFGGGVCFRCEGAKGVWVSQESLDRAEQQAREQREKNEVINERIRERTQTEVEQFAALYPDHWAWIEFDDTPASDYAIAFISSGDYAKAKSHVEMVSDWHFEASVIVGEGDLGIDYCIACGVATDEESGSDYCGDCPASPTKTATSGQDFSLIPDDAWQVIDDLYEDFDVAGTPDRNCFAFTTALAQRLGWEQRSGFYVGAGQHEGHYWNVTPDGVLVDPTYEQFDESLPVRVLGPGDPALGEYEEAQARTAASDDLPLEWPHQGVTLYHGTSPSSAKAIRDEGFVLPTAPTGRGRDYGFGVYFTPDRSWAMGYARGAVVKATLKDEARILDLAYAQSAGLIDKHYDTYGYDFWPEFAKANGWDGVTTNGEVVTVYNTSVIEVAGGRKTAAYRQDDVPPEPGETPLPRGHIRLFHVTWRSNLDAILQQGLTVGNAKGTTYGEPNLVWGSAGTGYWSKGQTDAVMVEFSVPFEDVLDNFGVVGAPTSPSTPEQWMAKGNNIGLPFDVPTSRFLAVHQGWHNSYRYLADSLREEVLGGEYDDLLSDPDYAKAIERIKREGAATGPSLPDQRAASIVPERLMRRAPELDHHLPLGYRVHVGERESSGISTTYRSVQVTAWHKDDDIMEAGNIRAVYTEGGWDGHWFADGVAEDAAVIEDVYVFDDHRRKGVASGMLAALRAYMAPVPVKHNSELSGDGQGWSSTVGQRTAMPLAQAPVIPEDRSDPLQMLTYRAEYLALDAYQQSMTMEEASDFASRIMAEPVYVIDKDIEGRDPRAVGGAMWQWLEQQQAAYPVILVKPGHQPTRHIVLHECAHLLNNREVVRTHDDGFRARMVDLVAEHFGQAAADELYAAYDMFNLWPSKVARTAAKGDYQIVELDVSDVSTTRAVAMVLDEGDEERNWMLPQGQMYRLAGFLTFDDQTMTAELAYTVPEGRRKGVQRRLWEAAERLAGGTLKPHGMHSPSGEGLARSIYGDDDIEDFQSITQAQADSMAERFKQSIGAAVGFLSDDRIKDVVVQRVSSREAVRAPQTEGLPEGYWVDVKDRGAYGTFVFYLRGPDGGGPLTYGGGSWGYMDVVVSDGGMSIYLARANVHNSLQGQGVGVAMAESGLALLAQEEFAFLDSKWTGTGGGNTAAGDALIRALQRRSQQRWGSAREAMADRSGNPEVDRLIEDFLDEPLGDWTTDTGPVRTLLDPTRAAGVCTMVTEQFVAFAKARGFKAYVTHTNLDEMGYSPTGEPQGEVLNADGDVEMGFYEDHCVASIYPEGARFPYYVDFTATQYGYSDLPKVTSSQQREAAWSDVVSKAARIRREGGVRILSAPEKGSSNQDWIVADVRGDTNVYRTELMRVAGSRSTALWRCGCAWAAYSWGRSGRWKKYEGRMCSHALAVQYEAQARAGFDYSEPIYDDPKPKEWGVGVEPQYEHDTGPLPDPGFV